jgi:hypothetical protein
VLVWPKGTNGSIEVTVRSAFDGLYVPLARVDSYRRTAVSVLEREREWIVGMLAVAMPQEQ